MSTEPDESSEPRSERLWLPHAVWAVVAVLAFSLGLGAGGGDDTTPAAEEAEPAPTVTVTAEPEVVEVDPSQERVAELDEREAQLDEQAAALDEREQAITATEQEIEEGTIPGDGIFLVGEDIEPGTYRGDGSSGTCYWARLSGTGGTLDEIITNGLPQGPTVVTIAESDAAFETTGCAGWVRQ